MSTNVQRQYWELKNKNPDAILFFRLGDFYELFFDDAVLASRILGIALTARHRGTDNEMPMCGFPAHAHKEYLEKLINNGYKIAIAEQHEDPETQKITRTIDRIVTPGTAQEDGTLREEKNSFLLAIEREKKQFALAYTDFTTGEFRTCSFDSDISFFDELYKLNPKEILIPSTLFEDEEFCKKLPQTHLTPQKNITTQSSSNVLKDHFKLPNLDPLGLNKLDLLVRVSGLILQYLKTTQHTDLSHISKLVHYTPEDVMQLDTQTYRHLEIFEPLYADETNATLWNVFEKSFTALGARTLHQWMQAPLTQYAALQERLDAVDEITRTPELQTGLRQTLSKIADLERLLARIATGRGTPRDFGFFRDSFQSFPALAHVCEQATAPLLKSAPPLLQTFEDLTNELTQKLVDHPPIELTQGGIFRAGVHTELDDVRRLANNSQKWLDEFLDRQKKETGINTLRVKFSKNFGFCLEVSKAQSVHAPENWTRRQTLVNAERYTTPELAEYEDTVLSAESRQYEIEIELFHTLREHVLTFVEPIQKVAKMLGTIDCVTTLARTALKNRWTRPTLTENFDGISVQDGRHPVVEKLSTESFIANDLRMDSHNRLHLITGPNMAGKSTFLRQNALLIFLAQIGSFVPAHRATLGIYDRIFTRVGASDNLAGGKSTFFVEMTETARILHAATERSFIILDEIGRGTSTFDGISLAWAITEFLHDTVKAKTLFATHYHELIDLVDSLSGGKNYHVTVSHNTDGIVFLHRIHEGGISDSFGIDVAESAGVPKHVTQQARKILSKLESDTTLRSQPTLFSTPRIREKIIEIKKPSEIENILKDKTLEELSPKEALDLLYTLKSKL